MLLPPRFLSVNSAVEGSPSSNSTGSTRLESCPTIKNVRLTRDTDLSVENSREKTMSSGKLVSTDCSPNSTQSLSAEAPALSPAHNTPAAMTTTAAIQIRLYLSCAIGPLTSRH